VAVRARRVSACVMDRTERARPTGIDAARPARII
jgi:hypothetical protein